MHAKVILDTRHHYQPTITRLPSLLCLLVASLGLIALVEVACRRLPAHNANGIITSIHDTASADIDSVIEARHVKRQNGTEGKTERAFSAIRKITDSVVPQRKLRQ